MNIRIYLTLLQVFFTVLVYGQGNSETFLFVGSYTSGVAAEGIYVYRFNTETGELNEVEREGNLVNPSFLVLSPDGTRLYACSETQLANHGSVSAFAIDTLKGEINFLNKQSTEGRNPAHVNIDKAGKYVVASNYTDAGICLFACNPDGSLQPHAEFIEFEGSSVVKGRQDEAHLHSSVFSPDNKFIFSPDLGADKIRAFRFNDGELLTVNDSFTVHTAKGSGPRHFTFHPTKKFAYCVNELNGTVSFYRYSNGQLSLSETYFSYEKEHETYSAADIHVSPDGKFLYASNRRAENSIAIFAVNQETGQLKIAGHQSTFGKVPRTFVIDPTGNFLLVANKLSDNIVVFRRNSRTGLLSEINEVRGIKTPSSLKMIEYGR